MRIGEEFMSERFGVTGITAHHSTSITQFALIAMACHAFTDSFVVVALG